MRRDVKTYLQAAALGLVAGMRSASAPAIVSGYIRQRRSRILASPQLADSPLRYLMSPLASNALRVFALGEMVMDKMPFVPKRTETSSLAARAVSGGLAGAVVGVMYRGSPMLAGLIGALSATGATFGAYRLRKQLTENTAVPDAVVGGLEDLLVLGTGYYLVNTNENAAIQGD
ncbi:MAG: DUF4126 family protein [Anaerolineaceae bacterium]|nr:DUF4126 family protein [Anaerolineaceae bacterium]